MESHMTVTDDEPRLAVALLLQPVVSFALGFLLFPVVDYSSRVTGQGRANSVIDGAFAFGFATAIVGGLVAMLGAWPVVVWLMRRGPVARRTVLLGGFIFGNVPAVLAIVAWSAVVLKAHGSGAQSIDLSYAAFVVARGATLGSLIGVAGAAVFWLVAREPVRHRLPDARGPSHENGA
jgi:hypothetical protein